MTALALLALELGQAGPLDLPAYRRSLSAVADAIDRDDLDAVRAAAGALVGRRVRHGSFDVATDVSLLGPLAKASGLDEARALRPRLSALIAALEAPAAPVVETGPDGERLRRILREEAVGDPARDGPIGPQLHAPPTLLERLKSAAQAILEAAGRVLRWLYRLLFGAGRSGEGGGASGWTALLIVVLVALLALAAALALRTLRRAPDAPAAASDPEPRPSAKDEDPLSRTAGEWERYAGELMRAGRFREAIRAWYHAALVTLFRTGRLHYRKDRTNWEYAFALPPEVPWRPGFLDATRTFEREWYGGRASEPDTARRFESAVGAILTSVRSEIRR